MTKSNDGCWSNRGCDGKRFSPSAYNTLHAKTTYRKAQQQQRRGYFVADILRIPAKEKKKKKKLIPFSRYFFPQSLLLSCSLNRIRLKRWCSSLLHLDKMNIGKKKCSVFATSPWVYKSWLKKPHEAAWKSKSGPGRRSTDGQKGGRKEREKKHFLFFIFGNNYHPVVAWHGQRYCTQQQLK